MLLLSTNSFGDFQPLHISSGNITKLTKLEGIICTKLFKIFHRSFLEHYN